MKQPLNFSWRFSPSYQDEYLKNGLKEYEEINIPHTVKEVPYNYFDEKEYQKVSTYEKFFDVDYDINNQIHILRFEGFMLQADIYLNGEYLGHHVSGYVPVEIDVTKVLKQKDNHLIVVLDSREDKKYPPFGLVVDYLTFSRSISLLSSKDIYRRYICPRRYEWQSPYPI